MARWASSTSSEPGSILLRGDSSRRPIAPLRAGAGFTIVELLIVVIVIAILAAITLVAFNNITNRAKASAAASAAQQAAKKVLVYMATNADQVPSDLATAGVTDQNGTTYQYRTYNNGQSFCITATSNGVSAFTNNVDQTSPIAGACPGHAANGGTVIANLIPNPSGEVNALYWSGNPAGGTTTGPISVNGNGLYGAKSVGITFTTASTGVNGGLYVTSDPGTITPGTTYTVSAAARASIAQNLTIAIEWKTAAGAFLSRTLSTPFSVGVSTWSSRVSASGTAPASASRATITIYASATWPSNSSLAVDGVLLEEGSTAHSYADGDSQGWVWNGNPGNSTSTGPAL